MAKKLAKLLTLGVLIIMIPGLLAGCVEEKLPYNAIMYGNIYENRTWLKEDFYEANLTYGSFSSAIEGYIEDEAHPSFRTKIIVSNDEYETVFNNFPVEVDFTKSMIVMHCFTTASDSSYEIKKIAIDAQNLTINYRTAKSKKPLAGNASMPLSKWVIVTMNKLDIETAEFIFENRTIY